MWLVALSGFLEFIFSGRVIFHIFFKKLASSIFYPNNYYQVAVKSFVDVIQTFKILKPVYKVDGDSYERI